MSDRSVLVADHLFDGHQWRDGRTGVVLDGNRIVDVMPAAALPHEGPRIIELPSTWTLLPGLIDMHVHLGDWSAPEDVTRSRERMMVHAAENARKLLAAGITTVRDVGAPNGVAIAVRDAVNGGQLQASRVFAAGRVICMTGGHGSEVADGAAANQVTGVDECRRAVREELRAGADLIKFTMDGARRVPGKAVLEFTQEEASAIVDEAHRLGVAAAAHTFQPETVAIALNAGADTIEHGLHLSPENIQTMVGNGTWLVPTVTVTHHIIAHSEREIRESNEYGAQALAHARQAAATQEASFRAALDAGVRILAGTDTSSVAGGLDSLPGELDHMRSLGMSIDDVLRSATSSAAEALDRVGDLGVVAPGALADLLAVDGVPSDDLSCLRRPRLVVTNGRFVLPGMSTPPPTSLPALLTMDTR